MRSDSQAVGGYELGYHVKGHKDGGCDGSTLTQDGAMRDIAPFKKNVELLEQMLKTRYAM